MAGKSKTIQSNLFLTYSLIIVIVLIVFVAFFYLWGSNTLKSRAFEEIDTLSRSFLEKLDTEIQNMDRVSMNICYSNLIKNKFSRYVTDSSRQDAESSGSEQEQAMEYDASKDLIEMLVAINGPSMPVQQIYLYDFNGKRFGTGFENRQKNVRVSDMAWYGEVMANKGRKFITEPLKDPDLSSIMARSRDNYYISLSRVYYDSNSVPQGIVEVKQYYESIFKSIEEYGKSSKSSKRVYVYNQAGKLLYPLTGDRNGTPAYYFDYYSKSGKNSGSRLNVTNPDDGSRELLVYKYSNYTDWLVMVVTSEKELLSPIFSFTRMVFPVAVLILFLALMFSFFAAKKYTKPIAKLRRSIRSIDLQEPSPAIPAELDSGLEELDELHQAFYKMNAKLKNSMEELLLSQQHEMQSKMLALQSQMNPHFLYNSLATISVMAEESMENQIVEMSGYVSDMLRYISSDSSGLVEITKELDYTEKYLACMKFRYGQKLSYSVEFDDDIRDVAIPKLMIQPLVENAIKYATHKEPPWNIRIYGYISNSYWIVNVEDNGDGFDKEKLDAINEKIKEIDRGGLLPSLELEGMGLLNIYIRLKLVYKNQMIFSIAENPFGGALVTIGGDIHGK
jgi:two-component system sensor histidine kinase YesM